MKIKIKPSFLKKTYVRKLFKVFLESGAELFVAGGAVRDALCGKKIQDIDFATNLKPQEIIKLLEKNSIKAVPTGEKHGTITAVFKKENFEITTYRADIETDGRHAKVKFVSSLQEDSKRRDFTINALYMDSSGDIFDFVGGQVDISAKIVRFIGSPEDRIKEDYLRILRFFRFSGRYAKDFHKDSLEACVKNKNGLKQLSKERTRDEIFKILCVPKAVEIIDKMVEVGIFDIIFADFKFKNDELKRLVKEEKRPDAIRRLILIVLNLYNYLPLSNLQKKRVKTIEKLLKKIPTLYEVLYYYGVRIAEDLVLISNAKDVSISFSLKDIEKIFPLPDFPIRGSELLKQGFEGKEIGVELKRLESIWLKSKCKMTKKELLV